MDLCKITLVQLQRWFCVNRSMIFSPSSAEGTAKYRSRK